MGYEVYVLHSGYSGSTDKGMVANCSCTLIRGRHNIVVDTMTPWDKEKIVSALAQHDITPNDIQFVVCTHGHSDHVGNNNLFLYAKHIVGYSVSFKDQYSLHPFEDGQPFVIDDDVKVIPTPGHTNTDVSVIVRTKSMGTVAVVGDLFEKEEDLKDSSIWRTLGGSENPRSQERYRNAVLLMADYIVPGHGPMFPVTLAARDEANKKSTQSTGQVNYLPPSFIKSGFAPPIKFETGGSRWLDDSSSNLRKRSPLSCSPQRYWEDSLSERDGGSGSFNKTSVELFTRHDLYGGLRESDTKTFYESGSRSLDVRNNFGDVSENRKLRGSHTLSVGESNTWEKKRFASDNILCGEDSKGLTKQFSNVDIFSRVPEDIQNKQTGSFKINVGEHVTSSSSKPHEVSKLSSRLDWQDIEDRSTSKEKLAYGVSESKLTHSYRLDPVKDKKRDQDTKFSSDDLDSKRKSPYDDKAEKTVSFDRSFYGKFGRGDDFGHHESLDPYKKVDTKIHDKTDDWWKTDKGSKDAFYNADDNKGGLDRNRGMRSVDPFKLDADSKAGSLLDNHSSKNTTMLVNVNSRREDRYNQVIT